VTVSYIDAHCHLAHPRLASDLEAVLSRAKQAAVEVIICAAGNLQESRQAARLSERYPNVYCLAGVHPHDARLASEGYLHELQALAGHPRCVAIGEIGLDYHYDFSPRDVQRRIFGQQLELAGRLGKPVVVHSREAFDETLAILADSNVPPARVVLHSFTEGPDAARRAMELGMAVSFSGIVTFHRASPLREAARLAADDRLLTETDAPYLSPEPVRKMKTNEPANVAHVAALLARVRNVPLADMAQQVRLNARRLFGVQ